jgi:hypothetical protein
MKPFQVTFQAESVEVLSLDWHQNPKNQNQNLWRIGITNGETRSFVYVPIARDAVATKNFKSLVTPGAIISFNGTIDNDLVIVLGFKLVRKAMQGSFDFEIAS